MQTAVSVKAGAAFLAGVVLALGGAITYFKVTDSHPKPAIQPVAQMAETSVPVPDLTPTPKAADPLPAVEPATESLPKPKIIHPKLILPKPKVTSRPVSLAVNHPPAQYPPPAAPPVLPTASQEPPPLPSPPVVPAQAPVAPPPPQAHTVTLAAGTSVAVRLNEKLSTDNNYVGDTFRATLDAPLVVDGFIIADRGAKVLGRIVKAQKPGKFEGMAELSLTLTEISTTDGQRMHVETNESLRKGPSNTNQDVMKMGGGAALGAIIGAIAGGGKGAAIGAGAGGAAGTGAVLLGHGKPAILANETKLTFELTSPTTLTEQLN